MAKGLLVALMLLVIILILGTNHSVAAINSHETMEVVLLDLTDERGVITSTSTTSGAGNQVQTSASGVLGWGPPYPWWPDRFCSWDYWTSAAWQITFVGRSARCNDGTGVALAGLASRTVSNDRRIQAIFKGIAWMPLTAAPVLCAQARSGQVTYTVRLEAPGPAVARLRTTSGTQVMRTVLTRPASVRTLKLSGLGFSKAEWIKGFWCSSRGCASPPANSLITGISSGIFTCTTPLTAGSNCSFRCNSGVPFPGTAPICLAGANWANAAAGRPRCVECVADSNCSNGGRCQNNVCVAAAPGLCAIRPLDASINGFSAGTFNCTLPVTAGSNCSFTCANGGFPLPDTFPICQVNGSWAPAAAGAPTCVQCLGQGDCDPNFLETCSANGTCQAGCVSFATACQQNGNFCNGGTTTLPTPICPLSSRPQCSAFGNTPYNCSDPAIDPATGVLCNGGGCTSCNAYCFSMVGGYASNTCLGSFDPPVCDASCFPATSIVQLRNGSTKTMEQLQSGDEVLAVDPSTGQLTYTTMYLYSHYNNITSVNYLSITTSPSNVTIRISPDHFMYRQQVAEKACSPAGTTASGWSAVVNPWASLFHAHVGVYGAEIIQAGKVRPGDVVFITKQKQAPPQQSSSRPTAASSTAAVESVLVAETVTSVVFVRERGRHAPKTHSGTIVVDGVLAHCQTVSAFMPTIGESRNVRRAFALLPDAAVGWFGEHVGVFPILQWLHGMVPDWFQTRVVAGSAGVGGYAELSLPKRWSVVAEGVSLAAGRRLREFPPAVLKALGALSHST